MTDIDGAISKKKCEEIAKLRKRMHCKIGLFKQRLKEMNESFHRQKNVNRTVKDGVNELLIWIDQMEDDHQEIGKETAY